MSYMATDGYYWLKGKYASIHWMNSKHHFGFEVSFFGLQISAIKHRGYWKAV